MHKYHLKGSVFLTQYCYVKYPTKTGLAVLEICDSIEDCEGHEVTVDHEEVCEGKTPDDAIGNWSLSRFEGLGDMRGIGDGLEPTWRNVEWTTE